MAKNLNKKELISKTDDKSLDKKENLNQTLHDKS